MKLNQIVKEFRDTHSLSQRQFSAMCGMSPGYISILEDGLNPRTKEPLIPTILTLRKLSTAMGISLDDLIEMTDGDMVVSLNEKDNAFVQMDERTSEVIRMFSELDAAHQETLIQVLLGLLADQKISRDARA